MKKIQLFVLLMVVGCTTKQPPADYNKISATVAERYAALYKAEQGAERPLYCQKLYDDSLVKYKTEQYVAAVIMLKQVVQMKGCDEELSSRAQYNIGNNYANDQFKLDEAKKAYQKVVDNYPEGFKYVEYAKLKLASYLLSDRAEAAYKAGNFTEAIALREEVIQQKRCDKELAAKNQYLAGYIYHKKLNDMDKAKAAFNNVIAIHPKSEYATKAQNKLTLEEGRTKAISAVQATPDDYGLIDLNDMENTVASERENAFKKGSSEGKAQGIEEGHASGIVTVRTTPYEYGLYTKADIKVHESKARELALEEGQLKGKRQGIKIVKTNPAMYGLTPFLPELPVLEKGDKSRASTNNQWHYQPEWGWLWTNEEIFPYVYLAGTGGKTPGWYYLPEVSGKSRSFYSYAKEEWATFDNK